MTSRALYITAWVILLGVFVGSLLVYPNLPPVVATHWSTAGVVNGTMGSFWGAFLVPLIMLLVLLIFTAIPRIDPLKANIESFRLQYDGFLALFMLVFAVIHAAVLAYNLGYMVDIGIVVLPAVGILIFYIGSILPQTKRNWFVGIRTPWTVSSDIVWKKTHELGGRLFQLLGVIIVLSVFVRGYALEIIVAPLIIVVVGLVAYSYVLYQKYQA